MRKDFAVLAVEIIGACFQQRTHGGGSIQSNGVMSQIQDAEFYHRADELALLARLKQELKRFKHPPVFDPDLASAQNLLASIRWYAGLAAKERKKLSELTRGLQDVVDSLVELLKLLKDPHAKAPVDDQFRRTRWLAAELIGYLTRANSELLLLGRPVRTYRGVPEKLVALVFGMGTQGFSRYEQQLLEKAKDSWAIEVSYVIDLFTRGPIMDLVSQLARRPEGAYQGQE